MKQPSADPQAETDFRGISLDHVGISKVLYPLLISGWNSSPDRQEMKETTLELKVSLGAEKRGIHMSRLLEAIHSWEGSLTPQNIPQLLSNIREQQGSKTAYLSCGFTWFVARPAPKTEKPSWQGIETTWFGEQTPDGTSTGYTLKIPVTTLCPCSRDISDYGAHSQRGWVKVTLKWSNEEEVIAPEEIFDELQHAGSAPIYPLLKREDERHVTMLAYDNPAFVEDTTRQAARALQQNPQVEYFNLEICNEESIHTHDAIASLTYNRPS